MILIDYFSTFPSARAHPQEPGTQGGFAQRSTLRPGLAGLFSSWYWDGCVPVPSQNKGVVRATSGKCERTFSSANTAQMITLCKVPFVVASRLNADSHCEARISNQYQTPRYGARGSQQGTSLRRVASRGGQDNGL